MAGVTIKMYTGDNVVMARSIALRCGTFTAGDIVMEGSIFRQLSDADMLHIVPRLQVLAWSPEDSRSKAQVFWGDCWCHLETGPMMDLL